MLTVMVDTKEKLEGLYTSFYKNIAGRKFCDMTIGRVLNGIRIGAYSKEISQARVCLNSGDKDGYDAVKMKLPAVTFCGTFVSGHSANECNTYNRNGQYAEKCFETEIYILEGGKACKL